jgi:hypothetical protein
MKSLGALLIGYGIGLVLGIGTPDTTSLFVGLASFVCGVLMVLLSYILRNGER